ncbi:hypothetical protein KEM54_001181 [Ascosphaera aggregata]|nr:hypothetical protein KEM54_001181 [Ascosphaera aggregata]
MAEDESSQTVDRPESPDLLRAWGQGHPSYTPDCPEFQELDQGVMESFPFEPTVQDLEQVPAGESTLQATNYQAHQHLNQSFVEGPSMQTPDYQEFLNLDDSLVGGPFTQLDYPNFQNMDQSLAAGPSMQLDYPDFQTLDQSLIEDSPMQLDYPEIHHPNQFLAESDFSKIAFQDLDQFRAASDPSWVPPELQELDELFAEGHPSQQLALPGSEGPDQPLAEGDPPQNPILPELQGLEHAFGDDPLRALDHTELGDLDELLAAGDPSLDLVLPELRDPTQALLNPMFNIPAATQDADNVASWEGFNDNFFADVHQENPELDLPGVNLDAALEEADMSLGDTPHSSKSTIMTDSDESVGNDDCSDDDKVDDREDDNNNHRGDVHLPAAGDPPTESTRTSSPVGLEKEQDAEEVSREPREQDAE